MSDNDYLDFELEIGKGRGRKYPLEVIESPAGEAEGSMRFPYEKTELNNYIKNIQVALRRSAGGRNMLPADTTGVAGAADATGAANIAGEQEKPSQEEPDLQELGQELFEALFVDDILIAYHKSQGIAEDQGKNLRIKLRIKSPEMALIPWELLFDKKNNSYLCLRNTPIVRYLEVAKPVHSLTVKAPLRILGMIASPDYLEALDVELEKKLVEEALKELREKGFVYLKWIEGHTWEDLLREMQQENWQIFYYIGHGGFDPKKNFGFIALQNEDGNILNASQLGTLIANQKQLRLVLLNSCEGARGSESDIFSSTAATLVQSGIPAVLAMQYKVSDRAAIRFARYLFENLSMGKPLESAVSAGRVAMYVAASYMIEWMIPVLYMRSKSGILFNIENLDLQAASLKPSEGPDKIIDLLDSMVFKIDTCLCGQGPRKGKAFFFKGDQYVRYDWDRDQADPGYPAPIALGWHNMPSDFAGGLDAAINGEGPYSGKAFFFKGDRYVRYDWENERADPGYPASIAEDWHEMPLGFKSDFDTAVCGQGPFKGKAYFFKGDKYVRYDWEKEKADPGYPASVVIGWQDMPFGFTGRLDAAINGDGPYSGKAFFFQGDQYVRYDWKNDRVDPGYPASISDCWRGLLTPPWTGKWETSWGIMELRQFGEIVTGRYTQMRGRIQGKAQGNYLSATWYQAPSYNPPQDSGELDLVMSEDKTSFSGNWWSSSERGKSEGKRVLSRL